MTAPLPTPKPVREGRGRGTLYVGAVLVGLVVLTALVSFFWTPYDPVLYRGTPFSPFSGEHLLGTDKAGRDVLSVLMAGARTTLLVGIVSVGIAAVIGVPLGIWSAMSRPWVSEVVLRFNDLLLAFPALLLAIMLAALYGQGTVVAMVAIGVSTVPAFARVTRSGALQVMQTDYVTAARAAGRSKWAIARTHVLPNVASLVIVQASVGFAIAILAEAALSFLGVGTPPDVPSWGVMLYDSQGALYKALRLAIIPGLAISLSVLGFNLLGDGLRDRLDPTLREAR